MSKHWTVNDIPELNGKVAIITGANSGIGYETAKALAEKGAHVVMACRNMDKAEQAKSDIRQSVSTGELTIIQLDLADLASVKSFAEKFKAEYKQLNYLINNAGVMIPPFTKTQDGFEVQFGANHLGHFALTGHLVEILQVTPQARIVNVSSSAHRMGQINFENLQAEKGYNAGRAYGQSKLANLLFTRELNRRLASQGSDLMATSAHPGWTITGLQKGFMHSLSRVIGQTPPMGALPTLMAAIDPNAERNDYYGPSGFAEMRGYPKKVGMTNAAKDDAVAKRLWEVSEKLTSTTYLN